MGEIITIDNLDLILKAMEESTIKKDICGIFTNKELVDSFVIEKKSASDSEVILSNFIANKKYKFGLSMKMWFDWTDISKEEIEKAFSVIAEMKQQIRLNLEKRKQIIYDLHSNNILQAIEVVKQKLQKYKKKFLQTKSLKEKIIKREEELKFLIFSKDLEKDAKQADFVKEFILSKTNNLLVYYALKYEKNVYEFITTHIIIPKISPNFIPLIASASCSLKNIFKTIPFSQNDKRLENMEYMSNLFPTMNLEFILTGTDVNKDSLRSLHHSMIYFNNPEHFMPVFFQIIYSLAVMDHFGITHNDLHPNNIFLQKLQNPIILSFNVDEHILQIQTKYIIKFFDWDKAYVEALGPNKSLDHDMSKKVHQFNKKRSKQDVYQLFCYLQNYKKIWNFIENYFKIIPTRLEYNFNMKKGIEENKDFKILSEIRIRNNDQIKKYLSENKNKYEIDSEGMYWTELDISFLTHLKNGHFILQEHSNRYPNKPYTEMDAIFAGLLFLDENFYIVDYENGDTVKVFFATGWYCQSYFDLKDSVLPPAVSILKSKDFKHYFLQKVDSKDGDIYNFPTKSFCKNKESEC